MLNRVGTRDANFGSKDAGSSCGMRQNAISGSQCGYRCKMQ